MIKVISDSNPRVVINKANDLELKRENIISIIKSGEQFLLIYWED